MTWGQEGKEEVGRCDWRDGKSSLVGGPWTVIRRRPRTRDGVNWNCRLQKPARVSNIEPPPGLVSGMELGDESLQNWKWKKGMIESWFSRGSFSSTRIFLASRGRKAPSCIALILMKESFCVAVNKFILTRRFITAKMKCLIKVPQRAHNRAGSLSHPESLPTPSASE